MSEFLCVPESPDFAAFATFVRSTEGEGFRASVAIPAAGAEVRPAEFESPMVPFSMLRLAIPLDAERPAESLYAEILRILEDLEDNLAADAALRDAAENGTIPLEQVKAELGL